jgi:hypothetical protein
VVWALPFGWQVLRTDSQTYGRILTVILHINDVLCYGRYNPVLQNYNLVMYATHANTQLPMTFLAVFHT